MNKKLNKPELIELISQDTELPKKTVAIVLNSFIKIIVKEVSKGIKVCLNGFGSFYKTITKEKICNSKLTGTEKVIPEHFTPKFKAGQSFKDMVK